MHFHSQNILSSFNTVHPIFIISLIHLIFVHRHLFIVACNNGYSLSLPQRHHGTLGPADIDLFASECSSILDSK